MNADSVRKIVALNRQIKALGGMLKSGELTQTEFEIASIELQNKISALRSQQYLPGMPPVKGGKGA